MDADFSIELGREDPVLDFPWKDPSDKFAYWDLKRCPESMARIDEAQRFPALVEVLRALNSARSIVETAKCDAWPATELSVEEEIYGASHKFASYVDAVFSDIEARQSLPIHEQFAEKLVALLRRAPELPVAAEVYVRRCFFEDDGTVREGFYFTLYLSGYGDDDPSARQNWEIGLKAAGNAIIQLSAQLSAGGGECS